MQNYFWNTYEIFNDRGEGMRKNGSRSSMWPALNTSCIKKLVINRRAKIPSLLRSILTTSSLGWFKLQIE
jgi:hypothetical protein